MFGIYHLAIGICYQNAGIIRQTLVSEVRSLVFIVRKTVSAIVSAVFIVRTLVFSVSLTVFALSRRIRKVF
jgi:hypothetical protein